MTALAFAPATEMETPGATPTSPPPPPVEPPPRPEPVAFNFTHTDGFTPLLRQLGVSLLVTTYQANKLLVLREQAGALSILVRSFDRPMGLAVDGGGSRMALGTRDQVNPSPRCRDSHAAWPCVDPTRSSACRKSAPRQRWTSCHWRRDATS